MRSDTKEQQKKKKLLELQSAVVDQVFTNEYSTVKIIAVEYIDGYYHVKWMSHEVTNEAIHVHELQRWIASRYGIRYYDIELKSS
jgi:hypothetical protein